ncbi:MAG: DUF4055 domain-containing protein [Sphingomonas sp.]
MVNTVKNTHPDYDKLLPKWKRCSDAVDGQDAIHAGGELYLRRFTNESDRDYQRRKQEVDFFNATWRTIAGLSGMAFARDPVVDVPAGIKDMLTDINLAGRSLDDLAKGLVEDALEYGPFGLMVDYPPMPENVTPLTLAAAESMGMRPSIQYYEITSVINWRYVRLGNRTVLGMVVLKEDANIAEGEFEHKTEARYRVLDLDEAGAYRQRVFRIDAKGNDELVEGPIYPLLNGNPLPELPFKIVGDVDEPPLIDLVDANIKHYKVSALLDNAQLFAGAPTMVVTGHVLEAGETINVGGEKAIVLPDPNARVEYAEFKGDSVPSLERRLLSIEQRMAVLGARMIADESNQAETLGATKIKRAGENSILANVVIETSKAIEWALTLVALWAGHPGACKYEINRDFNPNNLSAQQITAIIASVQSGVLSYREAFELLQRGDIIDGGKTFEAHQREIDEAPMPPPVAAVPPREEAA